MLDRPICRGRPGRAVVRVMRKKLRMGRLEREMRGVGTVVGLYCGGPLLLGIQAAKQDQWRFAVFESWMGSL